MSKRISINKLEPNAYDAMLNLENSIKTMQIPLVLKELIKIRSSQINKCAYCIDMHTEQALTEGETNRRIFALSAWKESHLFTEEERAVLQLTEEITLISEEGVKDETYNNVKKKFGEKMLSQIIMQIVVINSWNRIAVSTQMIYKK